MIQELINKAIAEGTNYVKIPNGTYTLNKGLVVGSPDYSFLVGFTIEAEKIGYGGESGVRIIVPKNTFGIAFQRCKSYRLKNIIFEGENLLWKYSIDEVLWSEMDWENGCKGGLSSHAAVIVDHFNTSVPQEERYTGFDSWYENPYGAGSTDGIISDCSMRFLVEGVSIHNGSMTGNGDCIAINDCWIDYCKNGVTTNYHQNRTILVNNLKCWGFTHTLFNCGNGVGCPVEVDGLDLAGGVRYLTKMHGFQNYNGLSIKRAHTELLTTIADGDFGRVLISDSWINLVPGRKVFRGEEIVFNESTLTYYGSEQRLMEFDCTLAAFNNSRIDELPINTGRISIKNYNRQGFVVSDGETFYIHADTNDSVMPYVVAQGVECLITYNYSSPKRLKFLTGEGYYTNGYLNRFLPNLCTGNIATGRSTITNINLVDEWRWRQFENGIQLVIDGLQPGTLITGYDMATKTVFISKPATKTGTRNINGVRYQTVMA
jgi:hypothetical protein